MNPSTQKHSNTLHDEIRSIRTIYDIHSVLGLESRNKKIVCPLPGHIHRSNTPSFHIWNSHGYQKFQCHGNCGKWGDVIDLVGYMQMGDYDPQDPNKVKQAIALLTNGHPISLPKIEDPPPELQPGCWRKYLPPGPEVIQYAYQRGLTDETMIHFKIGQYKHFMSIPVFENGAIRMIKFRNTRKDADDRDFDHLRFWAAKGSVKSIFNLDEVAFTTKPVLLLKGEIPTMLAWQHGFHACGLSTGEASDIGNWSHYFVVAPKIVVVGDNDRDPGVREKMSAKTFERAEMLTGVAKFPPEKHKDWDDWLLASPDEAIAETKRWLEV